MIFRKIHIERFLSIGDLTLDLNRRGLTLISGRNNDNPSCIANNGAGKSAIWDALVWCLYGKTIRDISPDDIINNKDKGECKVWVSIQDDNDKVWKIIRKRKDRQNTLTIIREGEDISGRNVTISQNKLNNLLLFDYQSFISSVIFGQDTLRFARLTDKEKKSVLEKVLGLEIYQSTYEYIKQLIIGVKLSAELTNSSYVNAKRRYLDLVHSIKDYKKKCRIEGRDINKRIRRLKKIIKKHRRANPWIIAAHEKEVERVSSLRDEMSGIQNRKAEIEELKESIIEKRLELTEISKEITLSKSVEAKCSLCGQKLSSSKSSKEVRLNLKKKYKIINDKVVSLEEKLDKLGKKCSDIKAVRKKYLKELEYCDELAKRAEEGKAKLISLKAQLKMLIKSPVYSKSALLELKKQCKKEKKEFYKLKADAIVFESRIKVFKYWERAFGPAGIRSYLLDDVVPFLNERANHYSHILTDGDMHIEFSTLTKLKSGEVVDKFGVEVKNKNGARTYGGNSAGERQRIDLCIAMALKDLARSRGSGRMSLTIFDEVFEKLDESGCNRVLAILGEEIDKNDTCFVITHNENLKSFFSDRIIIAKRNGITSIEN